MSFIQYSGMTTKIRAMESRLFRESDFRVLASEPSVPAALGFLKQHPGYTDIFADTEETSIHREQLEQMLTDSLYRDFTKLYRFANPAQRRFLSLYFIQFEADLIKSCLRFLYDRGKARLDSNRLLPFFQRYSRLDIPALWAADTKEELVAALNGSCWYRHLSALTSRDHTTLFDYEMILDLTCFSTMWKGLGRLLSKGDLEAVTAMFGSKLDIINLQWIYRAKKFYRLSEAEIYALLLPIHYRLREPQLSALAEAPTIQDFSHRLAETCYAGAIQELAAYSSGESLEVVFDRLILKLYQDISRRRPYSAASMNHYLRRKEAEIDSVTSIIEGIRYGMDPAANLSAALPFHQNRR